MTLHTKRNQRVSQNIEYSYYAIAKKKHTLFRDNAYKILSPNRSGSRSTMTHKLKKFLTLPGGTTPVVTEDMRSWVNNNAHNGRQVALSAKRSDHSGCLMGRERTMSYIVSNRLWSVLCAVLWTCEVDSLFPPRNRIQFDPCYETLRQWWQHHHHPSPR